MKKKSRRVLLAGAGAMVFSSVVVSAAFLTLNTPRAEFLPDQSLWHNSMLPSATDIEASPSPSNRMDFLTMDFAAYGAAFGTDTGTGAATETPQLAALGPSGGGAGLDGGTGTGGGGSSAAAGEPHERSTFSSTPSAWHELHRELERSFEPGANRSNGSDPIELSDLTPDDAMTPQPGDELQPIDPQPLPERPVAEPQSLALLLLGLAGLAVQRYRQRS